MSRTPSGPTGGTRKKRKFSSEAPSQGTIDAFLSSQQSKRVQLKPANAKEKPKSKQSPSSKPIVAVNQPTSQENMLQFTSSNAFKGKSPLGINNVSLKNGLDKNSVNGTPKKKLVIKTLKAAPALPQDFEAASWSKLQTAIRAIYASQPVSDSLEDLYRACENLCNHKLASRLYDNFRQECKIHVDNELKKLRNIQSSNDEYLVALNSAWTRHCSCLILIRSILLYLDRTYVLQTPKTQSLWDLGLSLFCTHLVEFHSVRRKTSEGLLSLIQRERNGESVPRALVKSLVHMHIDLGIYASHFENEFIEATEEYYKQEGIRLISEMETPAYIRHVDKRFAEENDRCLNVLDPSSKNEVIEILEDQLLRLHVSAIIAGGMDQLLSSTNVSDLELLYSLMERVNALPQLRKAFGEHIKKTGLTIVTDPEKDPMMVEELLKFKIRMDTIVTQSFRDSHTFVHAMQESFESFVNQRQNKPAEMIAKYLDMKLRSGNKSMSDEEMEETLRQILIMFRFVQSKDIFEAFYKRDLAKRLLLSKSASDDAERSMLAKLKDECGAAFTQKLEGMFKDIDISRDILKSFHASKIYSDLGGPDLDVNVLTTGFWPSYPRIEVTLPEQLTRYQEIFRNFYLSKHSGRRLMWQHSLGHCLLRARFAKGMKELDVSLFQAVVLLLFNDIGDRKLSYKEIKDATQLESKELERTLQSLACGKVRVLTKHPKGRDINETDEFSFNSGFTESRYRIRVNQIQLKETKEENQSTTKAVFEDRQFAVDAAIVRIMKARKTLHHRQLVSELYEMLKFPIQPSDLKKRVESLIDREYLERHEDNSNMYNYLA